MKKRNNKGFTLIELIVVIAIIAILAAVAIPSYINVQNRAQQAVDIGNAKIIANSINTHNLLESSGLAADSVVPVPTNAIGSTVTVSTFNSACSEVTIDMPDTDFQFACEYVVYTTEGDTATVNENAKNPRD